jgi:hypothetical protein
MGLKARSEVLQTLQKSAFSFAPPQSHLNLDSAAPDRGGKLSRDVRFF